VLTTELFTPLRRPPFVVRVAHALVRERWTFVLTLSAVLGLTLVAYWQLPRRYESHAKLLIEQERSQERLSGLDEQVDLTRVAAVGEKANPINNQAQLLASRPIFEEALRRLRLEPSQVPYSNLTVKPLSGSDLIDIGYVADSPERAAAVVNSVAAVYTERNLETIRTRGATARQFLEKRLPEVWNQLQSAQNRLESFQRTSGLVGTAIETDYFARTLGDLRAQVNAARADLAFTERKAAALRSQLPRSTGVGVAGLSQEPGFLALQTSLLETETGLADLKSRFGPANPQVLNAQQKRDELQKLLKERTRALVGSTSAALAPLDPLRQRLTEKWLDLEVERLAQTARLQQLNSQLAALEARRTRLPGLLKQQAQFQMLVDNARREYSAFKENYTQSRLAEQQSIGNVRVVEQALPNFNPTYPNRLLLLALGLVAGTGAGGLAVWLRNRRSDALASLAELQEALPLPILATLPWSGDGRLLSAAQLNQDALGRAYHLLQAHVRMLPFQSRVLAVCSFISGEGRTTVAANLALIESQAGRRVLLIDAHNRVPGQSEFWKLAQPGTTHGAEVQPVEVRDRLAVLVVRHARPSEQYREWLALIERVRDQYDRVIIDCAPLADGPDATLIASISDGVLWVSCPAWLGRRRAVQCFEGLRPWATRLVGQVVVGLEPASPPGLNAPARSLDWLPPPPAPARRWLPGQAKDG